jgi:hypothetical protein
MCVKNNVLQGMILFLIILLFFSCAKKTARTGESTNLVVPNNSEEPGTMGKAICQPEAEPEINYSEDAVETGMDFDNIGKILLIYRWTTEFEYSHISFEQDDSYRLFTAPEGAGFGAGFYRIDGYEIIMDYPYEILEIGTDLVPKTVEWLFDGTESRVLTYDKSYRDFDVLTCLRFGDKILRNLAIKSPVGEEYELDGFRVVKYPERERYVLILENLRIRNSPEVTADTVTVSRVVDWHPSKMRSVTSNIVYTDDVYSFDAKTIKTDIIDGIIAPWYRISIILDDVFSTNVWVFGGYLKEISRNEWDIMSEDYYKKLVQRMIANDAIER